MVQPKHEFIVLACDGKPLKDLNSLVSRLLGTRLGSKLKLNLQALDTDLCRCCFGCSKHLWRNWLARSAVNRKVAGSSPARCEGFFFSLILLLNYYKFNFYWHLNLITIFAH